MHDFFEKKEDFLEKRSFFLPKLFIIFLVRLKIKDLQYYLKNKIVILFINFFTMPKKYRERKFTYIFSENEEKREDVKKDFSKFIFKLWGWSMKKGLFNFELIGVIIFIIIILLVIYINLFLK